MKTDNARLDAKLALRRHFLKKYHGDGSARVLDCCQGDGIIWEALRKEFPVASYWGVDVKPAKGRLKIDSLRVLGMPGWREDVIDVDTYGSPWKHWSAMLPNVGRPTTVFLTLGQVRMGGGSGVDGLLVKEAGIRFKRERWPAALVGGIAEALLPYAWAMAGRCGLRIVEALEARPGPHARYFGLHLEM